MTKNNPNFTKEDFILIEKLIGESAIDPKTTDILGKVVDAIKVFEKVVDAIKLFEKDETATLIFHQKR